MQGGVHVGTHTDTHVESCVPSAASLQEPQRQNRSSHTGTGEKELAPVQAESCVRFQTEDAPRAHPDKGSFVTVLGPWAEDLGKQGLSEPCRNPHCSTQQSTTRVH